MKKLAAVFMLVLIIILSVGLAAAQNALPPMETGGGSGGDGGTGGGGGGGGGQIAPIIDAELAARLLLNGRIAYYEGNLDFTGVPMYGETGRSIQGGYLLDLQGRVTYMVVIDGQTPPTVVVDVSRGDEPLPGLPAYTAGLCTNYNLWVCGRTAEGQVVMSGNFSTELLKPGDPIVVEMKPEYLRRFVPYILTNGQDPATMRLRLENGAIAWYDQNLGGFVIWINPLYGPIDYEIYDAETGIIYARGTVGFGTGGNVRSESIINFNYVGGVANVSWNGFDYRYFDGQHMQATILRDGAPVPAAVYMTDTLGAELYVGAGDLLPGSRLQVRAWVPEDQGKMPLLADQEVNNYGWVNVNLPTGYERLVITIIGKPMGTGFCLCVQRGPGGKG